MIPEGNRALKIFSTVLVSAQVLFLLAFGGAQLVAGDEQQWLNFLIAPLLFVFPNGLCFALVALVGSTWTMLLLLAGLDGIVAFVLWRATMWSRRRQTALMVVIGILGPVAYGLSLGWAMWSFVEWGAEQMKIECARSGDCGSAS